MNRQAHLIIGVLVWLAYREVAAFFHVASPQLLPGIVAVAAGSLVPDLLEPPASANHHGICHSRPALKFVAVLFLSTAVPFLFVPGIPRSAPVSFASCFFLGYSSHLLADSLTRAGLPR